MKLLLDTHALLWYYLGDAQLSTPAQKAIEDDSNDKYVSPASYWEIAIKIVLGKYRLAEDYDDFIQHAIFDNGFRILPIRPRHTSELIGLPRYHNDPFDRLIIAQTINEKMSVVTCDSAFAPYPVARIW
jgi:PIN domain nuclease of toxin-antitoxin system